MDNEVQVSTWFGSLGGMVRALHRVLMPVLYRKYRDAVLLRCLHHCLHHHSHHWCRIKSLIYGFPP